MLVQQQGTIFAVDSGACVVQEALGSINHTQFSMDAIDYAWENDVTIIGSAADEDSFHQNFPGTNNHTIYVHAIQFNSTNFRTAKKQGQDRLGREPLRIIADFIAGMTDREAYNLYVRLFEVGHA